MAGGPQVSQGGLSVWRVTAMTRRLQGTVSITEDQNVCDKRCPHVSKSMPATVVTLVRSLGVRKDRCHSSLWTVDRDTVVAHSPGKPMLTMYSSALISSEPYNTAQRFASVPCEAGVQWLFCSFLSHPLTLPLVFRLSAGYL